LDSFEEQRPVWFKAENKRSGANTIQTGRMNAVSGKCSRQVSHLAMREEKEEELEELHDELRARQELAEKKATTLRRHVAIHPTDD